MMLGGYLALLPVIIPATVWLRYVRWVKKQPPGPAQELTKASHGAGMIWLAGLIVLLMHNEGVAVSSLPVLMVTLGVMLVWGALWLWTSGRMVKLYGSQGPLDLIVLVRSGVKIAVGCAVVHFLHNDMNQLLYAAAHPPDWPIFFFAVASIIAWFAAMWCISTGAVKILLVLLAKIRRSEKAPPAVEDPRGEARDASRAEARQAMRGKGGTASSLDERKF